MSRIIGGSMMLLLLLYPLRKQARFMRNAGPVKLWFRMHMTFGVLGPVCILYHCDFQSVVTAEFNSCSKAGRSANSVS